MVGRRKAGLGAVGDETHLLRLEHFCGVQPAERGAGVAHGLGQLERQPRHYPVRLRHGRVRAPRRAAQRGCRARRVGIGAGLSQLRAELRDPGPLPRDARMPPATIALAIAIAIARGGGRPGG